MNGTLRPGRDFSGFGMAQPSHPDQVAASPYQGPPLPRPQRDLLIDEKVGELEGMPGHSQRREPLAGSGAAQAEGQGEASGVDPGIQVEPGVDFRAFWRAGGPFRAQYPAVGQLDYTWNLQPHRVGA